MVANEPRYESLEQTAARVPRNGDRRPSVQAIFRWGRYGIKARDGTRVRLECTRVGGRLLVRVGALDEFFARLREADERHFDARATPVALKPKPKTPTQHRREKEIAAAEARLAAQGL